VEAVMGVSGPYVVDSRKQFPCGLGLLSEVSALLEYDPKRPVSERRQDRDEDSGFPWWSFEVVDLDATARERTFRVKIAARVQPVPPPAVEGTPIRPIQLEGVQISGYPKVVGVDRKTGNQIVKSPTR